MRDDLLKVLNFSFSITCTMTDSLYKALSLYPFQPNKLHILFL